MLIENPHDLRSCPRCGGYLEYLTWFWEGNRVDDVRCVLCSEYFFEPPPVPICHKKAFHHYGDLERLSDDRLFSPVTSDLAAAHGVCPRAISYWRAKRRLKETGFARMTYEGGEKSP